MESEIHSSTNHPKPKQTRMRQPLLVNLNDDDAATSRQKFTPILPNIPQEMFIEILSRLPVKSLIRFRCVCRSWLSLISDRQFVKKHLDKLVKHESLDPWRLIIRYPYRNLKSFSLYSVFHEPVGNAVDLHFPCKSMNYPVRIVGSCDGLVCISLQTKFSFNFFVWNPSTREFKGLPDLSRSVGMLVYHFLFYGFGYDCSGDDYKVVGIGYVDDEPPEVAAYLPGVFVYSLRKDCWRKVGDFPYGICSKEPGKLVNGTLNWAAVRRGDPNGSLIVVSFDLAEEVFDEVPQPDYGIGNYKLFVGVLKDCLCMICDRGGNCVDVWMMKEYGVKESWSKLVSMPYMPEMMPIDFSRSLCFLKYGGILMYFGNILVLYDLNEKTFKYPMLNDVRGCHEADVYLETLVSPNAYNGIGR